MIHCGVFFIAEIFLWNIFSTEHSHTYYNKETLVILNMNLRLLKDLSAGIFPFVSKRSKYSSE